MAKSHPERRRQQSLQVPVEQEVIMDTKWETVPTVQELTSENQELRKEVTRLRRLQLGRQPEAGASQISSTTTTTTSASAEPKAGDATSSGADPQA